MESRIMWTSVGVVVAAALVLGSMVSKGMIAANPFADKNLLATGLQNPTIWLYYNDSQVNSRPWMDFGARSSRVMNVPFLNLCYSNIVAANGDKYNVEVITGLADLASRLGGWEQLPPRMRNVIADVGPAEMNWIRATVLARFGGLWLEPSTICLRGFGDLPRDQIVFFGMDNDQTYAGARGTMVPSMNAVWAPAAGLPVFEKWSAESYRRLAEQNGGAEARADWKWDFIAYAVEDPSVSVQPYAELSRGINGRRIQLEEYLAAGQEGRLPFEIKQDAIYATIPYNELIRRKHLGWFLRLSEDQVMSSDLVIRDLFMIGSGL